MSTQAIAMHEKAPLVCECHDCTQARSLERAGGLYDVLVRMERAMCKVSELGKPLERIEATTNVTQQQLESGLARIERSQATLAGETMVLVLTKLLRLEGALCPPSKPSVGEASASDNPIAGFTDMNVIGLLKSTIGMCEDGEPHQQIKQRLWRSVEMLHALHKPTVAVAITDTKRSSSRKKRA
jgi:hypothetical protein